MTIRQYLYTLLLFSHYIYRDFVSARRGVCCDGVYYLSCKSIESSLMPEQTGMVRYVQVCMFTLLKMVLFFHMYMYNVRCFQITSCHMPMCSI